MKIKHKDEGKAVSNHCDEKKTNIKNANKQANKTVEKNECTKRR